MNFLIDPRKGRSILRPTDVLMYGWVEGKHACMNLNKISTLMRL